MKIKQVCEQTGLTDRAIRFYIEEGLSAPRYTQNYLGRKSFEFTQEDVDQLRAIGTLRKFGFTVEELKQLHEDPAKSGQIIGQIRARKANAIAEEQETLALLEKIGHYSSYSIVDIAGSLTEVKQDAERLPEEKRRKLRQQIPAMVWWSLLVLYCLQGCVEFIQFLWMYQRFTVFAGSDWLRLCMYPLLGAAMFAVLRRRNLVETINRRFGDGAIPLAVFIVISVITFCMNFLPPFLDAGLTTNPEYYRVLDMGVSAARSERFQSLFPLEIKGDDPVWYYWCDAERRENTITTDYEIYASWTLPEEEFRQEVERAAAVFPERRGQPWTKEGYQIYSCQEQSMRLLFAYNEHTRQVCYICYEGIFQPWYETQWMSEK